MVELAEAVAVQRQRQAQFKLPVTDLALLGLRCRPHYCGVQGTEPDAGACLDSASARGLSL